MSSRASLSTYSTWSTLVAGRTALRRMRVLSVVAGVAAVVVLGSGLTVALSLGDARPDQGRVASRETTSTCAQDQAGTSEQPGSCDSSQMFLYDRAVTYTPSGERVVRTGCEVVDEVVEPLGDVPAAAVAVSDGTDTEWALMKRPGRPGGGSIQEHVDPVDFSSSLTFESWVDLMASRFLGRATTTLVRFNELGQLVARPGWRIDEQATDVQLRPGYHGPSGVSAVVRLVEAPGVWFLVRPAPDGTDRRAQAFPLLDAGSSVTAVLSFTASDAYDPDRQGFLAPHRPGTRDAS